jgi:hypothetical protein
MHVQYQIKKQLNNSEMLVVNWYCSHHFLQVLLLLGRNREMATIVPRFSIVVEHNNRRNCIMIYTKFTRIVKSKLKSIGVFWNHHYRLFITPSISKYLPL